MIPLGEATARALMWVGLKRLVRTVATAHGLTPREVCDLARSVLADDEMHKFHLEDGDL
jgi:hypothetical protein